MTIDLSYLTSVDQKDFMFPSDVFFNGIFSRKSMVGGWERLTAARFFCNSVCGKQIGGSPRCYDSPVMARRGGRVGSSDAAKTSQVFFCR